MADNGAHPIDPQALAARLLEPNGENYQTVLKGIAAKFDEAGALQVPIDQRLVGAYQIVIGDLLQEKQDPRVRARALEVGTKLLDYNMRRAIEIDKRARLDTGRATDRTEHTGTLQHDHVTRAIMDDPEALALSDKLQARLGSLRDDHHDSGTPNGCAPG